MQMLRAPCAVPDDAARPLIFLSGSIARGFRRADWRQAIARGLKDIPGTLIDPTRKDWTARWETGEHSEPFRSQTLWEHALMARADRIVCHFGARTEAAISLLEFGLNAKGGKIEAIVPAGYRYAGSVRIAAREAGVPVFDDVDAWIAHARETLPLLTGAARLAAE